tara:strand:- start:1738 stop:2013 length:276 start_codon:yes stop_codon:yes gene_type:complete
MPDYTTTVTDTEKKCLDYALSDIQDWHDHALKNRAYIAKEEILKKNTAHCNANNIAIAVGEDAQVTQAYTLGVVKTAAQRDSEYTTPGVPS